MTPPDSLPAEAAPLPPTSSPGASRSLVKYARIFRVSLIERMTYRSDFLLGTILRFLPIVTTVLLWKAVYEGSGQETLGGFHYREMVAYLLLTHISRMFSSMPGLAAGVARDIRDGTLKRYLIQPLDLLGFLFSSRVAHKVAYITMSFLPYAGLFYVCRSYFDGFPDALTMTAYAASLILAFVVGFYFEATVGMVGFWFLEITSLLYIVMTLNFFISGHMLPLDLLPEPWAGLLKIMPFQYMAYFPAVVFLGKIQGADLAFHLALELFWAIAFFVLAKSLYRIGLKRYSAFGG